MKCKYCGSLYHEQNEVGVCIDCEEALFMIGSENLRQLIEAGWVCVTAGDRMREKNYFDGSINYTIKRTLELRDYCKNHCSKTRFDKNCKTQCTNLEYPDLVILEKIKEAK